MPTWTRTVIIITIILVITVLSIKIFLVDFFVTIITFCQRKGFIFFLVIVLSVKISSQSPLLSIFSLPSSRFVTEGSCAAVSILSICLCKVKSRTQ
jgi:hypothetical protein